MLLNAKKRLVSDAIQAALEICLGEWIGGETVLIFALREFNSPQLLRKPRKYHLKFIKKSGPKNPEKVRYPAGFPAGYLFGQLNLAETVGFEPTWLLHQTDFESKSKLVFSCPARIKPTFS